MDDNFDWPCGRREAHGPHEVPKMGHRADWMETCPGVKAHPNTMIGRVH